MSMKKIVITAEFEPEDDMDEKHGPSGLLEALLPFGLSDVDVEVEDTDTTPTVERRRRLPK